LFWSVLNCWLIVDSICSQGVLHGYVHIFLPIIGSQCFKSPSSLILY
jgi:hypothetical protein